jgi:hypothetical protein
VKGEVLAAARPRVRGAAEPAQAAHLRIGDHLRQGSPNGGVEGVSPARKKPSANLSSQRLRGNDNTAHQHSLPQRGPME